MAPKKKKIRPTHPVASSSPSSPPSLSTKKNSEKATVRLRRTPTSHPPPSDGTSSSNTRKRGRRPSTAAAEDSRRGHTGGGDGEAEEDEAGSSPLPPLLTLRREIGGFPSIPWRWRLGGDTVLTASEALSGFLADAEQALCGMCCRLLPHLTMRTNTCFLSVSQRGQTPPSTPTLRSGENDDDDDAWDAEHLVRRVQDEHENIYQRLRGTIAAACTLGHRACQVLWGAEGCGKSRLLRLAAADTRRRPNTLVFFLDGATLRSEEAAVGVMADQMFEFLCSPSSEAVRRANWSIRTGTFDFGRVFRFPERFEAHRQSELGSSSSAAAHGYQEGDIPKAARGGEREKAQGGGRGAAPVAGGGPETAASENPFDMERGDYAGEENEDEDDFRLLMTATMPHQASATAANALPYLHSALLLLRQHQVSILICIRHVDQFSVWCDQLLYVLAGLLHDATQEASGECGGFIFLLTNAAADMRQLEKRLSSRLTPETRYVPLLQWTPRRLVRATLQLVRDLFLCCYDAHAILLASQEQEKEEKTKHENKAKANGGEEGAGGGVGVAPLGVSLHAMAVLQQKIVALSHFFTLDILYGLTLYEKGEAVKRKRSDLTIGSAEEQEQEEEDEEGVRVSPLGPSRPAAGNRLLQGGGLPPHRDETQGEAEEAAGGRRCADAFLLYRHHPLLSDLMVRLCDAALQDLRGERRSVVGGEDGSGAASESTIASVLTSAAYEESVYGGDTSPAVAIATAAQVLRRAFSGALSVLSHASRETVATDLLTTLRHSGGGGDPQGKSRRPATTTTGVDIQVALASPEAILGAFHRLHYYEMEVEPRGRKGGGGRPRRTVALSATAWSRSVEGLYRFIAGAHQPALPAFLLDPGAAVDMEVDDEEALLQLLQEDFRTASTAPPPSERKANGPDVSPLIPVGVAVAARGAAWTSPASLAVRTLAAAGGGGGGDRSSPPPPPPAVSPDCPSDAHDLLQDGRWVAWGFASRESFLLLCLLALTYAPTGPPRSVEDVLEDVVATEVVASRPPPQTSSSSSSSSLIRRPTASQRREEEKRVYRAALLQLQLWHFITITPGTELVQLVGNARRIRDMLGYVLVEHPEWCEVQLGLDAKEILHARSLLSQ